MGKYNFQKGRTLIHTKKQVLPEKPTLLKRSGYVIGKALKRMCMLLGAMMILSLTISIISTTLIMNKVQIPLPDNSVLLLKIEGSITEVKRRGYFPDPFADKVATLDQIVTAIDKAANDDRIKGLILSLRGASISVTQAQEIRAAVHKFKDSGKFTSAFAISYGETASGLANYYLASVFDTIWMQPIGIVSIGGLNAEIPFFKGVMDRLGVKAHFVQRKEYKSAMESMTRTDMSEPNKESMTSIINDLMDQMVADISKDRNITKEQFMKYVDQGLFVDKDALAEGLIDRLGYSDMITREVRTLVDGDPESEDVSFINISSYYSHISKEDNGNEKDKAEIVVVHINGAIVQSDRRRSNMSAPLGIGGGNSAGADTISEILYDIAHDDDIKAVLLRINSPGGSPAASETIRRGIIRVKEKGKKVVVSMGSYAASGGYWIAADADYIFAQNSTLTGSIGVIGGKFELSELWEKLSVNWESIAVGKNSGMWSANKGFTESELKVFETMMDNVYENFVNLVSNGRGMSKDEVEEVARGRAWTGNQAFDNGLVDEIGGYLDALDKTAEMVGKADRNDLSIIVLPREKNPVEEIMELLGQQARATELFTTIYPYIESSSVLEELNVLDSSNGIIVYEDMFR